MSHCLHILTLTTGIKSPSAGWLPNHPKIQAGWMTACSHAEKRVKQGNHWANTAVALQHWGQNTNIYQKTWTLPPCWWASSHGDTGANGLHTDILSCTTEGAVSTVGSPSYVTATSLLRHLALYTWSHLLTCMPKQSILNSWEKEEAEGLYKWVCQTDMLHYSRGSRSLAPWVSQG